MGTTLRTEVLKRLIGLCESTGELMQHLDPLISIVPGCLPQRIAEVVPLGLTHRLIEVSALLAQLEVDFPPIGLRSPPRYQLGAHHRIHHLRDRRLGDTEETSDLGGGLPAALTQQAKDLHL